MPDDPEELQPQPTEPQEAEPQPTEPQESHEPQESEQPKPRATDWKDREIARLRARLREAREPKPAPAPAPQEVPLTAPVNVEAEIETRAAARASEIAARQSFDAQCAAAAAKGHEAFGEAVFTRSVNGLRNLVDQNDPSQVAAYNSFLVAALETGEAHKLVHQLGQDLDEAARIIALPATRQAVELTKLALKEPTEPSKTPRPIRPVGAGSTRSSDIDPGDPDRADQLPIAEWMRRREAQALEERKRRNR